MSMFIMNNGKGPMMWIFVALLCMAMPLSAAKKEPRVQKVYMFGFGASLTDSVACQTQVQAVDSAWLDTHDLLIDRSLYSIQLQFYVEQNEGVKNPICSVFFNKNERKVRKQWSKIKRRYEADPNVKLRQIAEDKFRFKAEEYRPVVVEETAATEGSSTDASAKDKKNKKDKKGRKGKNK